MNPREFFLNPADYGLPTRDELVAFRSAFSAFWMTAIDATVWRSALAIEGHRCYYHIHVRFPRLPMSLSRSRRRLLR